MTQSISSNISQSVTQSIGKHWRPAATSVSQSVSQSVSGQARISWYQTVGQTKDNDELSKCKCYLYDQADRHRCNSPRRLHTWLLRNTGVRCSRRCWSGSRCLSSLQGSQRTVRRKPAVHFPLRQHSTNTTSGGDVHGRCIRKRPRFCPAKSLTWVMLRLREMSPLNAKTSLRKRY